MDEKLKRAVVRLAQWADEHALVARVYVFGSVARDEARAGSDLDVLVAFANSIDAMVDRIIFDEKPWQQGLKDLIEPIVGLPVSVHGKPGDAAFGYVADGEPLLSYRKVEVVRTRPKERPASQ